MFEVFNPVTGKTFDVVSSMDEAIKVCSRYGINADYEPIRAGYWIKRNDKVIPRHFPTKSAASRHCDYENMCSDTYTYSFIHITGPENV